MFFPKVQNQEWMLYMTNKDNSQTIDSKFLFNIFGYF